MNDLVSDNIPIDKLVSIIIPVYNEEKYLSECLDSVINQTYNNLEILLINDGSTDGSKEICDKYAKKDNRINVIHKKNTGVSDSRNVGLDKARGEYLFFLDSDDLIVEETLETLVDLSKEHSADVIISELKRFSRKMIKEMISLKEVYVLTEEENASQVIDVKGFGHEICGNLYLRSLWRGIQFPVDLAYGEDYITFTHLLPRIKKSVYIKESLYYYRDNEESITNAHINQKKLFYIDYMESTVKALIRRYPNLEDLIISKQIVTYLRLYFEIMDDKNKDKNFSAYMQFIESSIMKNKRKLILSRKIRIIDKFKLILFSINKNLFYIIYRNANK